MKILFLLNAYEDDGPGRLIYAIIERLSKYEGVQCWTAALRRSGPLKEKFENLIIPTRVIGMRHTYQLSPYNELVDFIQTEKFDIVHTNLIRTDIIGRFAAKKANVPVIVTTEHGIHTWGVRGKLVAAIVKRLYLHTVKFTDCIIAVSDYVRESLLKEGVPPEKVIRIYNGVDLERFVPVSLEEKKEFFKYLSEREINHLIGGVGHLITLKGHSYFIQAIPKILQKHPNSLFVFVGEGPLQQQLIAEVSQLGLTEHVRFLGRLSAITPRVIAALDVLVQPSLTESFGLVVAEALACGVPVVATDVGGLPEIVQEGVNGFMVEPRNPEAIAEKVIWLLDHKEEARQMGERGREICRQKFDINSTVQQYYETYKSLLARKKP